MVVTGKGKYTCLRDRHSLQLKCVGGAGPGADHGFVYRLYKPCIKDVKAEGICFHSICLFSAGGVVTVFLIIAYFPLNPVLI